jgi:hypothetical protein
MSNLYYKGDPERISHPFVIVLVVDLFIFSYCVIHLFISLFIFLCIPFCNLLWALLNCLLSYLFYSFTQHFRTKAFWVFIIFDFLCVMCLIGHDSGVLSTSYIHFYFLFFYYGCQMSGLIKSRVYIFIRLVWIVKCNVLLYVMSITHHYVYFIILGSPQFWQMIQHQLQAIKTVDAVL